VIIALDRPPPTLGDGFRVEARIRVGRAAASSSLPALFSATTTAGRYTTVAGRAHLRAVKLAQRGRLEVQVDRGLEEGAEVVLYPGDTVREGVRVRARPD
jgi:HlyD family secretion protein